ncbi:response regulator, partial [Klebsiella pneumoniae]|nr:response regulator [Klebsiella pneumoniae]
LEMAIDHKPDIILLDLGMPRLDGVKVIEAVRGWSSAPILVISGRSGSAEKVEALDAGADDYVTKPFSMDELLARIRVLTRRI